MSDIVLCVINVFMMVGGQMIFKYGMSGRQIHSVMDIVCAMFSPVILGGLVLYGFTTMLWLYILSRVPISYAYPIQALAFPIVLVCSVFFFHEAIPPLRWLGICVIFFGVFICTYR